MYNTPILFIVFNRIDTATQVFEEIRKRRPKQLFFAADGPRKGKEYDLKNCQKVRDLIKKIDWECEVKTLFREENLGCAKAVSSAITWFFESVEQGIILEDDCLPNEDFFPYAEQLLNYHKKNDRVKMISGNNFQDGIKRGDSSYYFSGYSNIWGWATWKRAWKEFDIQLEDFSLKEFRERVSIYCSSWSEKKTFEDKFILMKKRAINSWAYPFLFCIWKQYGLCITPNVNLVSNIGFEGTHYKKTNKKPSQLNLPTSELGAIHHPSKIEQNKEADTYLYRQIFRKNIFQLTYRWFKRKIKTKAKF